MEDEGGQSIRFPDGAAGPRADGSTAGELLARWAPKRASAFLAALWNGRPIDLTFRPESQGTLAPLTFEDRAGWDKIDGGPVGGLAE